MSKLKKDNTVLLATLKDLIKLAKKNKRYDTFTLSSIEELLFANIINNIFRNLRSNIEEIRRYSITTEDIELIEFKFKDLILKSSKVNSNLPKSERYREEYIDFKNRIEFLAPNVFKFIELFESEFQIGKCFKELDEYKNCVDEKYRKFEKRYIGNEQNLLHTDPNIKYGPGGDKCRFCGQLDFVFRKENYISSKHFLTYQCRNCLRYFIKSKKPYFKYSPSKCQHATTGFDQIFMTDFPSRSYFGPIHTLFCLDCGTNFYTCMWIKNKLDKIYPYFWMLAEIQPSMLKDSCKYCSGKDSTDELQESDHANVRALELIKQKDPQLYNFFFGTAVSDYSKLIDKAQEERISIWEKAGEQLKLLDEYAKEAINEFRAKFGLPGIGEGWISETKLFKLVKVYFEEHKVYFHYRGSFLQGLELDIFIPDKKLAIEYMGVQHYEPVSFFGGVESHLATVERDKIKKAICRKHRINLIYFDYQTEVTMDNLKLILEPHMSTK